MTIPVESVSPLPYLRSVDSNTAAPSTHSSLASPAPYSLYRPWQRWGFLAILLLVSTSSYFDYFVLSIVLEPIKNEFHVSDTMLGLLSGFSFALCYALAALPVARWADRGNRRTVITVTLFGWSAVTALCGFARSFGQLVMARLAVGLTEPGAVPPAQSLMADYFPPERRGLASAVLSAGGAAGNLVGVVLGGYIASLQGWRTAFLWAGVPGLILAVIVWLTLPEPRHQLGFPAAGQQVESIRGAFSRLRSKRTFLYGLIGISVYTIFAYGVGIFLPSFIIRTLHATLAQVSVTWGFAISGADLVGAVLGGWCADRLSKRDIRWYAWLPAVTCALGAPIYWLALAMTNFWTFVVVDFLAEFILAFGICASFAVFHAVCGNSRRAMAIAIVQLSCTLVGCGIGPLLAGAVSDALNTVYGVESLRYSLATLVVFLLPAAAAFYYAGRVMLKDLEE